MTDYQYYRRDENIDIEKITPYSTHIALDDNWSTGSRSSTGLATFYMYVRSA